MTAFLIIAVLTSWAVIAWLVVRSRRQQEQLDSLWQLMGRRPKAPPKTLGILAWGCGVLAAAATVAQDNEAAASLDRASFPPSVQPYIYHARLDHITNPDKRRELAVALKLVIPSMSVEPVLDRCVPADVNPMLLRINTLGLRWDYQAWRRLVAKHPYRYTKDGNPGLLRADWLLLNLTDAHENPAYYELVFGGRAPKTRDEALKFLGVNSQPGLRFGMIEGQSGVAKQNVRWIENRPVARAYGWGTRDYLNLPSNQDPTERPDAIASSNFHDGEEWIIGIRKQAWDKRTQEFVNGVLQVYFLANGQGGIVDRAPVDLVEDFTEFRGYREIRTAGSCISCHSDGLNSPKVNDLRATITAGVDAYSDYKNQQAIEAFHFADLDKEIQRNNEDYAAIVKIACGVESPLLAADCYRQAIKRYDEPLDLERAAAELYCEPEELKLALALASAKGVKLTARLAGLAHGRTCPRDAWEINYLTVQSVYQTWRSGL